MKVRELMTHRATTVEEEAPIARARRLLGPGRFHALPVVDEYGLLCGIVTSADFVGVQGDEVRRPVREMMTRRVFTVREGTPVRRAARFMAAHHLRHLVITREGKPVGILSAHDVLAAVGAQGLAPPPPAPAESDEPPRVVEVAGIRLLDAAP